MADQLTTSAEALRLFFTDDIYLVESSQPAAESNHAELVDFKYLGKNQKNVLILVNDPVHEVSTESGRELLRKLVKAMQLTANDFALMNYSMYQQSKFDDLNNFFKCRLILAFGILPAQLELEDQIQHMLGVYGNTQLVFSGKLDELADDQEGKKKLWSSLKQITL